LGYYDTLNEKNIDIYNLDQDAAHFLRSYILQNHLN